MIVENTLFILGAGSSKPYGFLTGNELRNYICGEFPIEFKELMKEANLDKSDYAFWSQQADKLAKVFYASSAPSIDQFLSFNPSLSHIGKLAITYKIRKCEIGSSFRQHSKEKSSDWYSKLFGSLIAGFTENKDLEDIKNNKISFITFNYDRSLESFLLESFRNLFYDRLQKIVVTDEQDEIFRAIMPFKIFHVYGSVDKNEWEQGTPYREEVAFDQIQKLSSNIKTIGEINEADNKEINSLFKNAKRIYLLGFGYLIENMRILGFPKRINVDQKVYGTALNYSKKNISDLKIVIERGSQNKSMPKPFPIIEDMNCLELLNEYL